MTNARSYSTRDLTSADPSLTVPASVIVTDGGYVIACYEGAVDVPYDDLETLAAEHGLDVEVILDCTSTRVEMTDDELADLYARAVAEHPDLNQPNWRYTYALWPSRLARVIAEFALSEGYVQAAVDGGWDPMRYELLGGDLEYLRGEHVDSPVECAALSDTAYEELCDEVQRHVREILAEAVEGARAAA